MQIQETAGLLIATATVRRQVEAALPALGLQLLSHAAGPEASDAELEGCTLIVVDEERAPLLPQTILTGWKHPRAAPPALVLLRDRHAKPNANAPADLVFDGILTLPLPTGEMTTRLRDMVHAHRALARRYCGVLEELRLMQRVLQSVTNGVTVADATKPDLPLIYINPAFEKMTGYNFEEACGQNCRFLQGPDAAQPGLEVVREAMRAARDTTIVLKNYRKDGTPFWNELYLSPLRNEDDQVTHFAGIQSDVTVRVEQAERLAFLAHHDSLTGLANRELLFERTEQAILRAARNSTGLAMLFFDLNNFKHVNDVFGHEAGDALLRIVSERLVNEVRGVDTVARMGGDEFVVLLPDLLYQRPLPALIGRITEKIQEEVTIREQLFHPSASVGWAVYPADGHTPEALLKAADLAMYADKHRWRQMQEAETTGTTQ